MPTLGVPGPTHLVVAIDTSGSMSNKELTAVFGEIDALRAGFECKITVVQCDAVIQHVQEHDPWDDLVPPPLSGARHRVYGRGGTDLRVPFAWLAGRLDAGTEQPDALIYCTDGYGPFPSREPDSYPVLWILTAGGVSDVPFGDVLRLPV